MQNLQRLERSRKLDFRGVSVGRLGSSGGDGGEQAHGDCEMAGGHHSSAGNSR
jgi:hypothetical protein